MNSEEIIESGKCYMGYCLLEYACRIQLKDKYSLLTAIEVILSDKYTDHMDDNIPRPINGRMGMVYALTHPEFWDNVSKIIKPETRTQVEQCWEEDHKRVLGLSGGSKDYVDILVEMRTPPNSYIWSDELVVNVSTPYLLRLVERVKQKLATAPFTSIGPKGYLAVWSQMMPIPIIPYERILAQLGSIVNMFISEGKSPDEVVGMLQDKLKVAKT